MALDPREASHIKALFDAGAHTKALASAFGHDQRTIRKILRHWTPTPIQEAPLSTRWQHDLPAATLAAIHDYFAHLSAHEQAMLRQLRTVAAVEDDAVALPSRQAYDALLQLAQPQESLVALAQRLRVNLNIILLAYAEWRDQTESLS